MDNIIISILHIMARVTSVTVDASKKWATVHMKVGKALGLEGELPNWAGKTRSFSVAGYCLAEKKEVNGETVLVPGVFLRALEALAGHFDVATKDDRNGNPFLSFTPKDDLGFSSLIKLIPAGSKDGTNVVFTLKVASIEEAKDVEIPVIDKRKQVDGASLENWFASSPEGQAPKAGYRVVRSPVSVDLSQD